MGRSFVYNNNHVHNYLEWRLSEGCKYNKTCYTTKQDTIRPQDWFYKTNCCKSGCLALYVFLDTVRTGKNHHFKIFLTTSAASFTVLTEPVLSSPADEAKKLFKSMQRKNLSAISGININRIHRISKRIVCCEKSAYINFDNINIVIYTNSITPAIRIWNVHKFQHRKCTWFLGQISVCTNGPPHG